MDEQERDLGEPRKHGEWRDISTAPRNGSHILLFTTCHGIVEAWFAHGEWSEETPMSAREYTGPAWVCADDAFQIEVEEMPDGFEDGPATAWQPLPAPPPQASPASGPQTNPTNQDWGEGMCARLGKLSELVVRLQKHETENRDFAQYAKERPSFYGEHEWKLAINRADLLGEAAAALSSTEELLRSTKSLADAMWQLLDDMGTNGASVCLAAKAQARIAYEPFRDDEAPLDWPLEEAEKIMREANR